MPDRKFSYENPSNFDVTFHIFFNSQDLQRPNQNDRVPLNEIINRVFISYEDSGVTYKRGLDVDPADPKVWIDPDGTGIKITAFDRLNSSGLIAKNVLWIQHISSTVSNIVAFLKEYSDIEAKPNEYDDRFYGMPITHLLHITEGTATYSVARSGNDYDSISVVAQESAGGGAALKS